MTADVIHSTTTLNAVAAIVDDLSRRLDREQRYRRLLESVQTVIPCDATALLHWQGEQLVPIAARGLHREALGRRFAPEHHPRLAAILGANGVVRFPADSGLPDPYDGLVDHHQGELPVHACMGCPLHVDDQLWGLITYDALSPGAFDGVGDDLVSTISGLAAAAAASAGYVEALESRVDRAHELNRALLQESLTGADEMIGESEAMHGLRREIDVVAGSELSVLILGETGVGKELVARDLHARSARRDRPLIYLNCAALPESVAESELFGHVKGAFTGATADRGGKFETAHGGTLFLDEVGELPLALQAKLLRTLQTGELQRVGDDRLHTVDVRIIAATNRDLKAEVVAERFRADLFHRLSVYPVRVPPLRERGGDVELLAGFFLERLQRKLGVPNLRLSRDAVAALRDYAWPGNVRELEHVLSRAALKARASQNGPVFTIESDVLGADSTALEPAVVTSAERHVTSLTLADAVEAFQRRAIEDAVGRAGGNWAAAARDLGVHRGNLHRLARRLGLR